MPTTKKPPQSLEALYTIEEAAEYLSLRPRQVRECVYRGELKFIQLPRGRRIPESALREWIDEHTVDPADR